MRRFSALLLFVATTAALAQTSSNPPAVVTILPLQSNSNSVCPVGFFANRQSDAAQINSVNDATPTGPAQGLHLMLIQRKTRDIQSIEVTVYATSLKRRTLLLNTPHDDTISKTFTFERQPDSTSLTEADAWMHQVGSVRWADLISVAYTDGTTWHATENLKCRAVPSNLLLITSK
jgi:hypothetical protein